MDSVANNRGKKKEENSIRDRMPGDLYYLSNRPQVSMGYRLINHAGCW